MKKIVLILLFSTQVIYAVRSSIVVHPLVNQSHDALYEWVSFVIPEYFSRKLSGIEGIRVWDPIFMFQTDSTGWQMTSDSLLDQHNIRWMWDAAIGGKYSVVNDSLLIDLRIVWITGTRQHVSMNITTTTKMETLFKFGADLLLNTCTLLKVSLSRDDTLWIRSNDNITPAAYKTFCAGYGFEMKERYSEAQTAYNRAIDIDPSFNLARCRSGGLYMRTGNQQEAEKIFSKLLKHQNHTNATVAMTADFAVAQYSASKSFQVIDKYRDMLEKSAPGLTTIGKWYLSIGEYQRAVALLRRAIAWGTTDLEADFLLAMAYMWSGDYTSAIEIFNQLITIRPAYIRYQVSLGAVYRKAGRNMESLALLEAAQRKEPDNVMVLIEIAHTCFALKWYRKAGQLLEQARMMKPDQHEILIDLGIVYWHEKRFADSQRCFSAVEKEYKRKQSLMTNYGNLHLMAGDVKKAITAYKLAVRNGHRNPEILYNLAIAYLKSGDNKSSARYLDELIQLTPGRTDLLIIRAHLAQMLGKHEDAKMAYLKILENDPYHDAAIEGLVKLLIGEKKFEEAIFRIESYLEIKPARGDLMMLLGDIYMAQEWYEVALTKYEQVIQNFPESVTAYLGIGRCLYRMVYQKNFKKYDVALFALKQAGGKFPSNPEPYEMMGDIYMDYKGDPGQAIENWHKALAKTEDAKQRKKISRKIRSADKNVKSTLR